jgi:hypothetical protein
MFPDGWPGAALLLLRAAGTAVLIMQGVAYLGDKHELGFLMSALVFVTSVVGFLLLIGFLARLFTPVGVLVAVDCIFSRFPGLQRWSPCNRNDRNVVGGDCRCCDLHGPRRLLSRRTVVRTPGTYHS